jgi:predicted DCC family thiol-disulfide oxidoreductase YuxK
MTAKPPVWPDDGVILYDGVCVLCSGWVRFVARRDRDRRFRFTPIESAYGRRLAETFGIAPEDPDTNAVILGGQALLRSDAALAVVSALPGWGWVRLLRHVPRGLRDRVYSGIARNRYCLFGQHSVCDLGDASFADRVIVETPLPPHP